MPTNPRVHQLYLQMSTALPMDQRNKWKNQLIEIAKFLVVPNFEHLSPAERSFYATRKIGATNFEVMMRPQHPATNEITMTLKQSSWGMVTWYEFVLCETAKGQRLWRVIRNGEVEASPKPRALQRSAQEVQMFQRKLDKVDVMAGKLVKK